MKFGENWSIDFRGFDKDYTIIYIQKQGQITPTEYILDCT